MPYIYFYFTQIRLDGIVLWIREKGCRHDSLSLALVFRARVASNMTAFSLTPSSHRFLGFPICLLQWIIYCSAFFGIKYSSILITCPAHCSLLNFIHSVTFMSMYKPQILSLYLILRLFSSNEGPTIRLKIFLFNTSNISSHTHRSQLHTRTKSRWTQTSLYALVYHLQLRHATTWPAYFDTCSRLPPSLHTCPHSLTPTAYT